MLSRKTSKKIGEARQGRERRDIIQAKSQSQPDLSQQS